MGRHTGRLEEEAEVAVAQVHAFMAAGIVFMAAIGGIFVYTHSAGSAVEQTRHAEAAQAVDAATLLELLVRDPGAGWGGGIVTRLGLANENGTALNATRLAQLQTQGGAGTIDADQARTALGLPQHAGIRLQVEPLDSAIVLDGMLAGKQVLYIGDWTAVAGITLGIGQGTLANANAQLNLTMAANGLLERNALAATGADFDNRMHIAVGAPTILVQVTTLPNVQLPLLTVLGIPLAQGDVLHDGKTYIDAVLPGKLATGGYDVLVVGSGVDQSALTGTGVQAAIASFVRGGGDLVVLGSASTNVNWLQALASVTVHPASGALAAATPEHPILSVPNELPWPTYPLPTTAWAVDPTAFDAALMQGTRTALVTSQPEPGMGRIVLTMLQPRLVAQQLGVPAATQLLQNLLLEQRTVEGAHVVFGDELPGTVTVSSAQRTALLDVEGTLVPVRLTLWAWATQD